MRILSEIAWRLASAADARGDRERSVFWTDVECWLLGYGPWRVLRARSARRSQPRADFSIEWGG